MSPQKPSVCVVLAITSESAFFEIGKIINLIRAYNNLTTLFPDATIHVAASTSDIGKVRSILGDREKSAMLTPCESMEPDALAKEIMPLSAESEAVIIQDACRPFADHEQFVGVLNAFDKDVDAVRPATAFTETLKIVTEDSVIQETLDRSSVLRISTPELIRISAIDINGSDCGWFLPLKEGARVVHTEGNPSGLRLNSKDDAELMELQQY